MAKTAATCVIPVGSFGPSSGVYYEDPRRVLQMQNYVACNRARVWAESKHETILINSSGYEELNRFAIFVDGHTQFLRFTVYADVPAANTVLVRLTVGSATAVITFTGPTTPTWEFRTDTTLDVSAIGGTGWQSALIEANHSVGTDDSTIHYRGVAEEFIAAADLPDP